MNLPLIILLNVALAIAGVAAYFGVRALIAMRQTRDYYWTHVRDALDNGYVERDLDLRHGLRVHYAEGPANGPPLLLVPGQGCRWHEYARVLTRLAATHHVVAIDVHGHGDATWNPDDYRATTIADDLAAFIERVFGEPAIVAGHSSGGLIAARLAAAHAEAVRGVLFEDPPFFSTAPDRVRTTFSWIDSFQYVDEFLAQDDEPDWVCFYLPRSYWRRLFGPLWNLFTRNVIAQRRADPHRLPVIRWLSVPINRIWESNSHPFDLRFSRAFADDSWFEGFDQAETLRQVRCPSLFLKATTRHDRDGNLLAALSDDDLARVESLLPDGETVRVRSSHDIHFARSKVYVDALGRLTARVTSSAAAGPNERA